MFTDKSPISESLKRLLLCMMFFAELMDTMVTIFRPIIYLPAFVIKLPNDSNFPTLSVVLGAQVYFLCFSGVFFTYFRSGILKRRLLDIDQHHYYRFMEIYAYIMFTSLGITLSCFIWMPYFEGTLKNYDRADVCIFEPLYCGRGPIIIASRPDVLNAMFRVAFWISAVGIVLYSTTVFTAVKELFSSNVKKSSRIGQVSCLFIESHSLFNGLVFIFATKAYREKLWSWLTFRKGNHQQARVQVVSLPNVLSITEIKCGYLKPIDATSKSI
ncbi:unnamed protein product, partial [Mesorhabditis spiculigera]